MGFQPSLPKDDIWMQKNGDVYEYIASYVDNIAIIAKDPQAIIDALEKEYRFKLKGTVLIKFHLGCDFLRDVDGVLCFAPQ